MPDDEGGELERRLIAIADRIDPHYAPSIREAAEAIGELRRTMRGVHDELTAAATDPPKAFMPSLPMWLLGCARRLREAFDRLEGGIPGTPDGKE